MDQVAQKINELREQLESAAFLVAQPNEHKAAHKEIVKALISLAELDIAYARASSSKSSSVSNAEEIEKVKRRLKLWAQRPHQINARILTAYLKLERQGVSPITENALRKALGDETSISSNLLQMRISAEKNHGKVFDQNGDKLTLWPPVEPAIREYEELVFEPGRLAKNTSEGRRVGERYTEEEIVLCTFIARYGNGPLSEEKVARYGGRSADSVKMKVQNIVAMLDEKGIERCPDIAPLSGKPRGETGRETNWPQVEQLVSLEKSDLWAECKNILIEGPHEQF